MVIGRVLDLFNPGNPPNNFTEFMGALVKQARQDAGLSQRELARKMYSRQATISDIENGKRYVNSAELISLSAILDRPILYFFPEKYRRFLKINDASSEINELILLAKKLDGDDLKRLIVQTRALAKSGK